MTLRYDIPSRTIRAPDGALIATMGPGCGSIVGCKLAAAPEMFDAATGLLNAMAAVSNARPTDDAHHARLERAELRMRAALASAKP